MTVAAEPVTTCRAAHTPAAGDAPVEVPRLADGVELLGEYKDSGYSQPPSLVRRADGQVIQMSPLLYRVTCRIDGSRDLATIAESVSQDLGRSLNAEQVRLLITAKLLPLGVVAAGDAHHDEHAHGEGHAHGDGHAHAAPKANPLLSLRARGTLLPERAVNAIAVLLRPLFRSPVVVAVVGSVLAVDYWLFAVHGLGGGIRQVLRNPVDLLIVVGLTVVAAAFHECGHATACRYGGARPGVIGVGIYLIWPSFFTNVTDSYRLSRAGRLRTDLGGLYFNAVFILVLAGIYAGTSSEILLLVIAVTHLEMLEQLLPFVRFDGYFILSDLVGVPDLFGRVIPILKAARPAGRRDPRVTGLRPRARIVVTSWVVCVVPLLSVGLGYLLLRLPEIDRALWRAAAVQARLMPAAFASHRYAAAAVAGIGVGLLVLPVVGSLYLTGGMVRRAAGAGLRWSAGRPARRLLAVAASLACLAALTAFWAGQGQFRGW
jgi:putative peptide zinc metalloprotease protein